MKDSRDELGAHPPFFWPFWRDPYFSAGHSDLSEPASSIAGPIVSLSLQEPPGKHKTVFTLFLNRDDFSTVCSFFKGRPPLHASGTDSLDLGECARLS